MAQELWQQTQQEQMAQARELGEIRTQLQHLMEAVHAINEKFTLIVTISKDVAMLDQCQKEQSDSLRRAHERAERVEREVATVREDSSKWINRGLGAWVVGAALVTVIQALVIDRVKNYETLQASHGARLDAIDRRLLWLEYGNKGGQPAAEGQK